MLEVRTISWVWVGAASGLRLWFMSSFETIGVTVKEDFVRVGWIWDLFLLEFALGQMVRSGVMDTSVVGVGVRVGKEGR